MVQLIATISAVMRSFQTNNYSDEQTSGNPLKHFAAQILFPIEMLLALLPSEAHLRLIICFSLTARRTCETLFTTFPTDRIEKKMKKSQTASDGMLEKAQLANRAERIMTFYITHET